MLGASLLCNAFLSLIVLSGLSSADASASASKVPMNKKRLCRACVGVASIVGKRMAKTANNKSESIVGTRVGEDGRLIVKKVPYVSSEERYMDVFEQGLCGDVSYSEKAQCFDILNEYEDQIRDWFKEHATAEDAAKAFEEDFCFRELDSCNADVAHSADMDTEPEEFEQDQDDVDSDFMPEFTEEAVKQEEASLKGKLENIVDNVLDARDDTLDYLEAVNEKAKSVIKTNILSHPLIKDRLPIHMAEHVTEYWYLFLIATILSAVMIPYFLLCSSCHRSQSAPAAEAPKNAPRRQVQLNVPQATDCSSSDADEADAENEDSPAASSGSESEAPVSTRSTRSRASVKKSTSSDAPLNSSRRSLRSNSSRASDN